MKLNLGCGTNKVQGYVNLDVQERCKPDMVCDITKGLPFDDNSVDEVRAFDFLEHIPADKCIAVVNEIWRVLKPDGLFESFTPDAEHGQGAFQDPTHMSFRSENTWLYYSDPYHRDLYGIEANFEIEYRKRLLSDIAGRIYHLHIKAKAVKDV